MKAHSTIQLLWFLPGLVVPLTTILSGCSERSFDLDPETEIRAIETLRQGLENEDFWPSIHAAEGLILAGYGEEVHSSLEAKLLEETDDRRRCGLARELVRAGDLTKIQILADILADEEDYAHVHAAESLYKLGQIGNSYAMAEAFSSDTVALHLMAAGALSRQGDPDALKAIRTMYATGEGSEIRLPAWLLGRVGTEDDISLLRSRIDDAPDELIRAYIHHSLAALGDTEGFEKLTANLRSENPAIRTYAATFALDALDARGAVDAGAVSLVPRLIEMLDDPHPDARYRAAQTLLVLDKQTSEN